MTRRALLTFLTGALQGGTKIHVPVQLLVDPLSPPRPLQHFLMEVWTEAVRDFARCGIQFDCTELSSDLKRSPSGRPVFAQLRRGAVNVILTARVPLEWDEGRALEGITTIYEGNHVCLIALQYAHRHQIPFLSVNTAVHELLHVLMHDVFERRPSGFAGGKREFRIDFLATRLWLFHDGGSIREAARHYIQRIRTRPS